MSDSACQSRRRFVANLMVAGSTLALSELGAQTRVETKPLEKSRLTISVEGKAALSYLPLTIAQQLGYFTVEGLDVQVNDFVEAGGAAQALTNGTADVCSGTFDRTLQFSSASAPLLKGQLPKAFVLQGRTPQLAFGVSARNLPLASMSELRSKKLGVTALDSTSAVMVKLLLSRVGLTAQDVSLVPVGSSAAALNALRSGQIDAICNVDPVMTVLEQKGEIKVTHDTRSLKGATDLFGALVPSACLYAPADFIQKNPQTCQALANAIVHSLKWLQTAGPGDIINTVPTSYLLGDRGLYLAAFNKVRESISLDGLVPDEGALAAYKAQSRYGSAVVTARADVAKSYTNEFARRAKTLFRA